MAALLCVVLGISQVLFPQADDTAVIDPRTRVLISTMTLTLWLLALVYLGLARRLRNAWPGRVEALGIVLLSVGSLTSAIKRGRPGELPLRRRPANTLWFRGSTWLAVALFRARALPPVLALAGTAVQPTCTF